VRWEAAVAAAVAWVAAVSAVAAGIRRQGGVLVGLDRARPFPGLVNLARIAVSPAARLGFCAVAARSEGIGECRLIGWFLPLLLRDQA